VVLCKGIDAADGRVTFVSNYDSRKGRELGENSRAALVMHWDHAARQVRIEGVVVKASAHESDEYFRGRAWHSQLGAWASAQSQPLNSREQLTAALRAAAERFGAPLPTPNNYDSAATVLGRLPRLGGCGRALGRRRRAHSRTGTLESHFDSGGRGVSC
jgi:pyridoxamine 5'-phosphate oxidase